MASTETAQRSPQETASIAPNPQLDTWAQTRELDGHGKRAVVVGAGGGADAAYLADLGFSTTGFDGSETAVRLAQQRFPGPGVRFVAADLLALPTAWERSFDLVVEIFTVENLPRTMRPHATAAVRRLVADGGTLVVIASALGLTDDADAGSPWLVTRDEMEAFADEDFTVVQMEAVPFGSVPGAHRWGAEFRRTGPARPRQRRDPRRLEPSPRPARR